MNKAGCRARSIAARISAMRLVTPVEVSLWTTHTALDLVGSVGGELLLDQCRIDAVPPIARHKVDFEPEPRRHRPPQGREMAGLEHQHPVARRQRVGQAPPPTRRCRKTGRRSRSLRSETPASCRRRLPCRARRIPARDGRSSARRSPAARGRAHWSGRGSAENGGRSAALEHCSSSPMRRSATAIRRRRGAAVRRRGQRRAGRFPSGSRRRPGR